MWNNFFLLQFCWNNLRNVVTDVKTKNHKLLNNHKTSVSASIASTFDLKIRKLKAVVYVSKHNMTI